MTREPAERAAVLCMRLRAMRLGARVRARGREGVVQMVTPGGGFVGVQWDGDDPVARATWFDAVEVVS